MSKIDEDQKPCCGLKFNVGKLILLAVLVLSAGIVFVLLNNKGASLLSSGHDYAHGPVEQAPADQEAQLGQDNATVANALRMQARESDSNKQYEKAEPLYEQSIAIYAKLGKQSEDYATAISFYGDHFVGTREFSRAIDLYKEALPIYEKIYGPKSKAASWVWQRLGYAYRLSNQPEESKRAYAAAEGANTPNKWEKRHRSAVVVK